MSCNTYITYRQWCWIFHPYLQTLSLWVLDPLRIKCSVASISFQVCLKNNFVIKGARATSGSTYFCSHMEHKERICALDKMSWATLTHVALYLSAGSVGMRVRSAVNAVLTELVRSLSRALAAVLWRPSGMGEELWGPSLAPMAPASTIPPPTPPHSFLFLFTLMWKADGDEEDRRKAAELEELVVRSSEPDPSLPFSSSSSERRAMSPYKKRPAGGAVRSMANVIFTASMLWQLQVNPRYTSTCWGSTCNVCYRKFLCKLWLLMLVTRGIHPLKS